MTKRKKPPVVRTSTHRATRPPAEPFLGAELQGKIGDQLRALHDDIVKEGVPPRFAELLERLDRNRDKG